MDDTSPRVSKTPVVSNIETPIPTTSPLPSRYRSLRDNMAARSRPPTSMWDPHITPTTGSFVSRVPTTPVTLVPTNPTICVAYSSPVVSAVTALSAATPPSGTSHVSGGQPIHTPRVIHPAQSAPPSSGLIPAGGAHGQIGQDPDAQGASYYYDYAIGQFLYLSSPLPSHSAAEVSMPLSIAWGPTLYHGAQVMPGQPQGPPNQGQPLYTQNPQGHQYYGSPPLGQPGGPQGQPY